MQNTWRKQHDGSVTAESWSVNEPLQSFGTGKELEKIAEREEMDRKVRAVKEKAAKQERSRRAMMRAEARMHMHKGKEGGNVRRVLDNTSVVKTNLMKIDALSLYESQ